MLTTLIKADIYFFSNLSHEMTRHFTEIVVLLCMKSNHEKMLSLIFFGKKNHNVVCSSIKEQKSDILSDCLRPDSSDTLFEYIIRGI